MKKWKHKILTFKSSDIIEDIEAVLNSWGEEGWEASGVAKRGHVIIKKSYEDE